MNRFLSAAALITVALVWQPASAAPEDEVRAQFDRFVAAQNSHDINAVRDLLLDSPTFLWIARGTPVWGREAALKRFEALFQGTWALDPRKDELKITMIRDDAAQLFVPIMFSVGPAGQPVQPARFLLMNQLIVKTPSGWKTANILPIAAADGAGLSGVGPAQELKVKDVSATPYVGPGEVFTLLIQTEPGARCGGVHQLHSGTFAPIRPKITGDDGTARWQWQMLPGSRPIGRRDVEVNCRLGERQGSVKTYFVVR